MSFATYLFDLDGTLLDSVELILASHRHARRVHFGDSLPDAHYIATMGRTLRDVYTEMVGTAGEVEAMIATYREHNHAHHDRMVRAYPGIRNALQALRDRGARLAVVTSKARALAVRGLRVSGLDGFFSVVIGGDDVTRGKPDPEPVKAALAALGVQPDGALMVGDSTHDLIAARRSGVRSAAVLWGPSSRRELEAGGADYYVATPSELLTLVRQRGTPARG